MLDAIVAAFSRYGASVQHMFPEQLSTRITLWRVYARRATTQRTIDSATWRTTVVPAEERVTAAVLLIDQRARIVAVSARAPMVRARVVAHLDSALQARSRRLAGY